MPQQVFICLDNYCRSFSSVIVATCIAVLSLGHSFIMASYG